MKNYGQFCPLAQATQLLCERWTLIVVRELIAGSTRFNELQKGVPLMSPTLLSTRLKQLANAGVIDIVGKKGSYRYQLTEAGKELRPVVELLGAWGHRWARSRLDRDDPGSRRNARRRRGCGRAQAADARSNRDGFQLVVESGRCPLARRAGRIARHRRSLHVSKTARGRCRNRCDHRHHR